MPDRTSITNPAEALNTVAARATVLRTPCGEGSMVWRVWGEGEPVVLLHGGFGSWYHWARNVEALAEHYRVIAADMPGQGDSDDSPHPYDADSLAAIVTEGVRRVTQPGERLRLVCFSFGAVIGGLVAASLGGRVVSFTGVGAAGMGARGPVTRTMIRVEDDMNAEEREAVFRHNLGVLMFADAGNIDALALYIQASNTARNRIRSRPISLTDRLARTFSDIQGRINLIWGSEDITAVGYFERRHDALRAIQSEAGIAVLNEVGHWVQYEDAARFNATLLRLLAED